MDEMIYRSAAIQAMKRTINALREDGETDLRSVLYECESALESVPVIPRFTYERRNNVNPSIVKPLKCVCGSNEVYHTPVEIGVGKAVEELYCPECGTMMRAPSGMLDFLIDNWRTVHMNQPHMQTPMSPDELRNASKLVYIEYRNRPLLYKDKAFAIRPAYNLVEWSDQNYDSFSEYNKSWRCWLNIPTMVERSAAKWQD